MLHRIATILEALAYSFIKRFENPEQMINLAITKVEQHYNKLQDNVALSMVAYESLCKRITDLTAEKENWSRSALKAIADGNESAAREAVVREHSYNQMIEQLRVRREPMNERIEHMKQFLFDLELKKTELNVRKDELVAGFQMTEIRKEVRSIIDGTSYGNAFKQLEEKIDRNAAYDKAMNSLTGNTALGHPVISSDAIEARLLELKQESPKLLGAGK